MNEFNQKLKEWLEMPNEMRDYAAGAKLLLQLSSNMIMYRQMTFNLEKHKADIDYQLQKYYDVRIKSDTHEQVQKMSIEVDKIVANRNLDVKQGKSELQLGKRSDHESLPEEIKQKYVDNLGIRQRMRDVHNRLRLLSEKHDGKLCPDSDRYPYLKELISLDKKYRENWKAYDCYDAHQRAVVAKSDTVEESKKCLRLCNLNKGKYKKSPNEALKAQLAEWYSKVLLPPAKLTQELTEMGII